MDTATPNDLTEIAVILDRSGSMAQIKDDMEGGLWTLITEQHGLPGRCRVSLYQFDDQWEPVFEGMPSGDITRDHCRLVPRGSTALHDAVVKSLAALEARILAEPETERPSKVAVIVITDGCNNASVENTKKDSQKATARAAEKFGWKFVFLAADEEGFADGDGMTRGILGASVAAFDVDDVRGMYQGTSLGLANYRSGKSEGVDLQDSAQLANVKIDKDQT